MHLKLVAVALSKGSRSEDAALLLAQAQLLADESTVLPGADHVLSCVAVALARIGKPEETGRVAREIHEVQAYAQALSAVAASLARSGRWEEAESLADDIPDVAARARVARVQFCGPGIGRDG